MSRTKQLVKSPKFYWTDVGLAQFLSRERESRGEHLENVVAHDLLVWRESQAASPGVFYWRTSKGYEIDFVIDAGHRLLPIEVKATQHPSTGDMASMHVFLNDYSDRATAGLLLHTGEQTFWIARNVLAVPWWRLVWPVVIANQAISSSPLRRSCDQARLFFVVTAQAGSFQL